MANDSTSQSLPQLRFVLDEAADEDSFGPHQRVADAIADVIRSDNRLNVIGLLGPWGSGKSTVVKLIAKKLNEDREEDAKHLVFTYDAWLHQSDPPRRAFLETLIKFLCQKGLTADKTWRTELDKLSGRIKETTTTDTPLLTRAGRLILLSLALVPYGSIFVSHDWYKAFQSAPLISWTSILFICGLLIFVSPLVLALYFSPLKLQEKDDDEALSIFLSKQIKKNKKTTVADPDPTAIEFQRIFRKIIGLPTLKVQHRKLIFVIDNLDRLPASDALPMWATIRSFFLGAIDSHMLSPSATPTIILPIDERAISSIFPSDDGSASASFLAKTFDLTFRITKPVLSGWEGYLNAQLRKVFGSYFEEDWAPTTARFYHQYEGSASEFRVTPRSVNRLVNDIGTCWLQWRGDKSITFAAIAYYCVFRAEIDGNILMATASPKAGIDDVDRNWAKSLAALHYGVEPEAAQQILIDQPLRNAIQTSNQERFDQLTKIQGFWLIFLRLLFQWKDEHLTEPDRVFASAVLISRSSFASNQLAMPHWRALRAVLLSPQTWKTFGKHECDALIALTPRNAGDERRDFLEFVADRLGHVDVTAIAHSDFTGSFCRLWKEVSKQLDDQGDLPPSIFVPGGAREFLAVSSLLTDNGSILSRLKSDGDAAQFAATIHDDVTKGREARATVARFRLIEGRFRDFDLLPFINGLADAIRTSPPVSPSIVAAVTILGILRKTQVQAVSMSETLCTDGQIISRLLPAAQKEDIEQISALLAYQFCSGVVFDLPDPQIWPKLLNDHPQLTNQLNSDLSQFTKSDQGVVRILHSACIRSNTFAPIAKAIFSLRVRSRAIGLLPVADILEKLNSYLEMLDQSLHRQFIIELSKYDGFWEQMQKLPLTGNVAQILNVLIEDTAETGTHARTWLLERLNAIEREAWKTSILRGTSPLDVYASLVAVSSEPYAIPALFDALQETIPDLLSSNDEAFRLRWFQEAQTQGSSKAITLYRYVADQVSSAPQVNEVAQLIRIGGRKFLELSGLSESPDKAVRHVVLPALGEIDGVTTLDKDSEIFSSWIAKSERSTVDVLSMKIREMAKSSGQVEAATVHSLASKLGLVVEFETASVEPPVQPDAKT